MLIPEEIRDRLGLEPGAQFGVIGEGDVVIFKTLKPPKADELKALWIRFRRLQQPLA